MIAFIIFGTRGVRSTIKEGQFYCPQCDAQTRYKHKKVTQFFTLYFIPLIPLGNKGQYVECMSCRNTYIERILQMRPTIDVSDRPQSKRQVSNTAQLDQPAAQVETQESSVDILSEKQKAIKKLLIMMILADGKIEDREIQVFHKVYKETAGTYVANIYHEIDVVQGKNESPYEYLKQVANFLNDEGKRDILKACMMIAAADGDIDPSEVAMVENFGKALDMTPTEVRSIVNSIKVN